MIVFWKVVFYEDLYLFGEEYDNSDYYGTHELKQKYPNHEYELTKPEIAVNYIMGVLFVAAFSVSTVLNPLLLHYYSLSKSKATRVFQLLAASDFLTNLIVPLVYAVMMFR